MWLSFHVYFGDHLYGRDVDRLLVSAIAPLVEELSAQRRIERWFFVRYGDPESHVRLRLEVRAPDADGLGERVDSAIEAFFRREASGGPGRPGRLERVPYAPEVERYGGRRGLRLAERHFLLSSTIALGVLGETLDRRLSARLGKALFLAVILVESVRGVDAAASFLDWYAEAYLRHLWREQDDREAFRGRLDAKAAEDVDSVDRAVAALLSAMERGERLRSPLLDAWSSGCRRLLGGIRGAASEDGARALQVEPLSFLASLLHMHHNRLGLSIPQEVHLAHLAARSLARRGAIAS
jgi:thiopeptide-type bacteriocin biosynthesis protein